MDFHIEIVVLLIIGIYFFVWKHWEERSKKKLIKNYSPEKDISKNEDFNNKIIPKVNDARTTKEGGFAGESTGTESSSAATELSSIRDEQSERRELLPTANDDSPRKNRFSFRNLFKRKR